MGLVSNAKQAERIPQLNESEIKTKIRLALGDRPDLKLFNNPVGDSIRALPRFVRFDRMAPRWRLPRK